MKKIMFSCLAGMFLSGYADAQITITSADMPVNGDTLRWSAAAMAGTNLNLSNTGANVSWDYSSLVAQAQGIDHYQTALQVNPAYAVTIATTAYGYKVADSLPGLSGVLPIPISISNIYSFFSKKNNPSRFVAEGFAATISGLPTPAAYSDEDEVYFFPLTYNNRDSSTFKLSVSLPTLGAYSQQGYRITKVDGWGRIKTPYFTTDTPAIRVRSELTEVDTITVSTFKIGVPRVTVEYRWLVNGQHYPALIITATKNGTTETPGSVRYRDIARPLAVTTLSSSPSVTAIEVWPNPANGKVTLGLPALSGNFTATVYDVTGKAVMSIDNSKVLDVAHLAAGQYMIVVSSANWQGIARLQR